MCLAPEALSEPRANDISQLKSAEDENLNAITVSSYFSDIDFVEILPSY